MEITMFGTFFSRISRAAEIRRSRRELMRLNDRQLRDIGITREQAVHEAGRAGWF